jgi:hypothetical protein
MLRRLAGKAVYLVQAGLEPCVDSAEFKHCCNQGQSAKHLF